MARQFVAAPATGLKTTMTPNAVGKEIPVVATLHGTILEAGDLPGPSDRTIAALKAKYWNPTNSELRIPYADGAFTIGLDILGGLPDTTLLRLQWKFVPA